MTTRRDTRRAARAYPALPSGLLLEAIEPEPGRWTIVSSRLAAQLEITEAQLGAAMRRHVARFGDEYAAEVPSGTKILELSLGKDISVVLIAVKMHGTESSVLAVLASDEQEEGERAVGRLRRFLQAETARGGE